MISPPGSATVNIPHRAETSTKIAQGFTCQCKKHCTTKYTFKRHKAHSCKLNPSKGFYCPKCQQRFSRPDALKRHLRKNRCLNQTQR
ncbi:uncharacterized protein TrAtP1_001435 [Trichoderma atroviride]|uniref:uncharacterized protein n=1 Tax=Hypocrea atroviridis TaxID=63577 RepID=UPI0033266A06|nr:hypothetical protein TrAtP1_001435 [Trichoderma atroviride]